MTVAGETTVLVTGANGFIGRAVSDHLSKAGFRVRRAVRGGGGDVPVGEIDGDTDWTKALTDVDAVVHCAGLAHDKSATREDLQRVNVLGTRTLARQAVQAGVRRMVFLSSIGVNGEETRHHPFTDQSPASPHSPYAASKLEAETWLRTISAQSALELVIIRPPLVIGATSKGSIGALGKLIRLGLPNVFSMIRNKRSVVFVNTLCEVIEASIVRPEAAGKTLLVADDPPKSTGQIYEAAAEAMGRGVFRLPVPPVLFRALLALLGKRDIERQLFGDLLVDGSAARRLSAAIRPR